MSDSPQVEYFRQRREGPEALLEDQVAGALTSLLPNQDVPSWTGGSLRLGGGMPDLLVATFRPEIMALAKPSISETHILAYLRALSSARPEILAAQMRQPEDRITEQLDIFESQNVVRRAKGAYYLRSEWKEILPTIISVEVKVSNWKKGISQASRNTLFSHFSYLAVPARLAERLASSADFKKQGIGLLCIGESSVRIKIPATKVVPKAWAYYYRLAGLIAQRTKSSDAIRG